MDLRDRKAFKASKVSRAFKAQPDPRAHKEILAQPDQPGRKEPSVIPGLPGRKGRKAFKAYKEMLVLLGLRAHKATLEQSGLLVLPELQAQLD